MGRAIKLVLYYFAYQLAFTFLVGLPAGIIKVMNEISENDNLAYAAGKNTASMTGLVMVLAGIAMIWHLIYFKYVQFNKTSWTEVPAKTILLSIPFIIAAMFICNVASEFIELPNLVEYTFIGMMVGFLYPQRGLGVGMLLGIALGRLVLTKIPVNTPLAQRAQQKSAIILILAFLILFMNHWYVPCKHAIAHLMN